MKKPLVVLTSEIHAGATRKRLATHAQVLIPKNNSELKQALPKADALITLLSFRVDRALISNAPRLRAVGNYAVGYDNIDLRACEERGIGVVNTPDVLTRSTAELAAALLFAVARRLPEGETLCRAGKFRGWAPDLLLGLELRGRHAVIAGSGRIGSETARIFSAIGLSVEAIGRIDTAEEIEAKLRRAQVLSLHLPYSAETHHWLNRERIGFLPRDAIVINTARGPVIDEKALIQSLRAKKIFGAGLDVFENEPKIPLELRRLKNAVLLPHVGSATFSARERMAELVIDGVLGILRGENPPNRVV